MAPTALAPSMTTGHLQQPQDPFATPKPSPLQAPPPCAQISTRSALLSSQMPDHHSQLPADNYDPASRRPSGYSAYKSSSLSSGGSSLMSPMSSIDLEKSKSIPEPKRSTPPRIHHQDPEKAMHKSRRDSPRHPSTPTHQHHHSRSVDLGGDNASLAYSDAEDAEEAAREKQEQKAVKVLLFLSGANVVLSALNLIWTLIAIVITTFTQPVRLCARRPTFGQQLSGLLGPALNLQLKCIYTPLPPHANDDRSYHSAMLVMVHLMSPFISMGIMFMAWVLAVYWLSSAVVGDPAGMDKRDDGRETVLGLRGWWERYLMRSVQDE